MTVSSLKNYFQKNKHIFSFNNEETKAIVISVLVMAFIVSFDKWGDKTFSLSTGLFSLFKAIIILSIVFSVHLFSTKLIAYSWGFKTEYKLWWYGLIFGLILTFLSGSVTNSVGKVTILWFLAPGGVFFHHQAARRLGWFRYGLNYKETAFSCLAGCYATLILAEIFKILFSIFPKITFFHEAMIVSLWFTFFSILPIPPLNGSRLFYWSRIVYFFNFGIIVGLVFLLRTDINLFIMILLAFVIGIVTWLSNLKLEGFI